VQNKLTIVPQTALKLTGDVGLYDDNKADS